MKYTSTLKEIPTGKKVYESSNHGHMTVLVKKYNHMNANVLMLQRDERNQFELGYAIYEPISSQQTMYQTIAMLGCTASI